MCSLPSAVHKHDFTSFLFPEFIRTFHKFMEVQMWFFVNLEACITYSYHTVYLTHLQYLMSWIIPVLPLIFTLLHVGFDIKLRDSTGQVHRIGKKKRKAQNGEKKKRQ